MLRELSRGKKTTHLLYSPCFYVAEQAKSLSSLWLMITDPLQVINAWKWPCLLYVLTPERPQETEVLNSYALAECCLFTADRRDRVGESPPGNLRQTQAIVQSVNTEPSPNSWKGSSAQTLIRFSRNTG